MMTRRRRPARSTAGPSPPGSSSRRTTEGVVKIEVAACRASRSAVPGPSSALSSGISTFGEAVGSSVAGPRTKAAVEVEDKGSGKGGGNDSEQFSERPRRQWQRQ